MRLIGTLQSELSAKRFASYLKQKGIESSSDVSFDASNGKMSYQLWIHDEDKISSSMIDFERFVKDPSNVEFDAPLTLPPEEVQGEEMVVEAREPFTRKTPFTFVLILLCSLIFIYNSFEEITLREEGLETLFMMTPIQTALLYDVPPSIEALEKMVQEKSIQPSQTKEDLSSEVEPRIKLIEKMPSWRGVYDWIILRMKGQDTSLAEGPLFYKIRQGEVWRLFSPCLLHAGFLHILFNMIWLFVLGKPIEQRVGLFKTGLLTLAAGIGSNTIQYLVSGPFFIGYSGVVMALAGFIWMRQRIAPWEGYPLNKTTVLFLLLFVGSMALLTFASFFLQIFTNVAFSPNIANTAHIAGALIGASLARLSFFNQGAR